MKTIGDRKVFWLTVKNNDVGVNEELYSLSLGYSNLYIIDWNEISKGHQEYLLAGKIHLSEEGNGALKNILIKEINNKKI